MKPEILKISTIYGQVGWIVYTNNNNLFDYKIYKTKKAALKNLKESQ